MKFRVFTWIFGLVFWLGAVGMAYGADNAQFISQSVPSTMDPGQTYSVSVTMQNTGTTTWSEATSFHLGSQNPQDNTTWGTNRVIIPSGNSVAPGANYTFTFNVTAPATAGFYNFQWKMVHDGVAWFGPLTANVSVIVGQVNSSQFVSQSVPTSMVSNQTYAVSVTMKNTGSTTWATGTYYLGSQNPQDNTVWGLNRVDLAGPVAPGENATFAFNVTPTVGGVRNFQWQMTQGGTRFGALTTNVAVSVSGTDNAQFISQSVPNLMVPGQVYPVSITMQNTGNTTWSAGNAINLGSQNPQDNTTWGMNRVIIPSGNSVTPGANYTFTFNVTAPTATGNYNFQWKMVHDGVAWFGASSTNVVVADNGANNAQFVSQAVPNSMVPSQSYAVSITMQNTGTTTWVAGTYYLGSQNTQDNTSWGLNRVNLANAVAPGSSITLSFNVTAPTSAGSYNFQWQMTQNGTRFGAASTNVAVSVQVAQNPEVSGLLFIHTDHLNTPRVITNATSQVVWRWDQAEPFAADPANGNPSGLGAFEFNLRMPGQYFDKETNLHYNYFRDYDPATGRYPQFDPIGLRGGINGYAYVGGNPISRSDPFGLEWQFTIGIGGLIGGNPYIPIPGPFVGGGLSVGFTTSGQIIVQAQATGAAGVGVFAGVGVQGQVSKTKCPTPSGMSVQQALQVDANFGAGPSVGGSIQYDPVNGGGGIQTGVGRLGVGYGLQASGGVTQTVTIATPALFPSTAQQCGCQ